MKIDLGYISVKSGENQGFDDNIRKLDPKEIVLKQGEYKLVIDYPLNNPFEKMLKIGPKGISRKCLTNKIVKYYHQIYNEEDKTSSSMARLGKDGGNAPAYNREQSDGKYGIWGHVIGDLVLHTVHVGKKNTLTLDVDS